MAVQRPLVLVGGRRKQLPVGDTLDFAWLANLPTTLAGHNITLTAANVTAALTYTPVNLAGDTMTGDLLVSKSNAVVGVGISGTRNGGVANYGNAGVGQVGLFSEHAAGTLFLRPNGRTDATGQTTFSTTLATLTTRQLVSLNVAAISNTSYADGHLELRTTDNSLPRIGFHRAGTDALALYYNGGSTLRVRQSNGNDYALWHEGNILNIGTTATSARTALALGTMATEAAANYLLLAGGTMTGNLAIGTQSGGGVGLLRLEDGTGARAGFTTTGSRRYTVGTNTSSFTIRDESGTADRMTLTSAGAFTFAGSITCSNASGINASAGPVQDQYGNVRVMVRTTSALTAGHVFVTAAGFTINTGFAAGNVYGVYNNSASAITLTQGIGLTLRLSGTATTGNRTLAARGFASFWCNSTTEYIISGDVT